MKGMKTMRNLIALTLMALAASLPAQDVALSLDSTTSTGGTTYADQEVLARTGASAFVMDITGLTTALPANADIDALDYITPTNVYFSLDAPTVLTGPGLVEDEDIVNWDGASFTLAWDGSANGLPPGADIDALNVDGEGPLAFRFSLDAPAVLTGPGLVQDEDLVTWNGSAFTGIVFPGSLAGVPANLDLDAFNDRGGVEWVISFDGPGTIDGVSFDDEDLVVFNVGAPAMFTGLFFDGSAQSLALNTDLDAAEATPNEVPVEMSVFTVE
jgi:hypothetical protein